LALRTMVEGAPRETRRRRPWLARQDWYFAIALASFVGVAVWFGRAIEDFFTPPSRDIPAPMLVGETLSDALQSASSAKVSAVVVARHSSDRYPKDVVMRQDPAAGARVRAGRQISLVVSNGVQIFAMPDLRYESLREVGLDLSHDQLTLGKVHYVLSADAEPNQVVTQDPAPLTAVRPGSVVNLEIAKSAGSAQKAPDFEGKSIDEARDMAAADHMRLGQVVWTPFGRNGPPRGEVVRQVPGPSAPLDSSQLVSLQVSAGPREAGYLVRQVHATVFAPDLTGTATTQNVRIEVRDETGTWNVYDAFAQPRQKLDFNLTVIGTSELDVYVNNELLDSTQLGVEPPLSKQPTKEKP
jgi:serine/threonine-protein kinase